MIRIPVINNFFCYKQFTMSGTQCQDEVCFFYVFVMYVDKLCHANTDDG